MLLSRIGRSTGEGILLSRIAASRYQPTDSHSYSSEPISLSNLKRGTGGRTSFNGITATVFGASGYLGKHVVTHLGRLGAQVIIPYRGDPYFIRDLKVCGDLGQILFCPFHVEDEEALEKSMRFSNVAINLIGKFNNTRNFTLEQVNVDAAARIARISKKVGVERFVHVSSLCQNPNPEKYVWKASEFLRTKAIGEQEVVRERPDAIVFRPSNIWGNSDRFLCYYASGERRTIFTTAGISISLWKRGKQTVKQPVYVGDITRGIINSLTAPNSPGTIYEAVGPHRYRLDDLVKWILFNCYFLPREVNIANMNPVFFVRVLANEFFSRVNPSLCFERMEHDSCSDTLSGAPTLLDLDINLTKLEDRIQQIVYMYRRVNNYWEAVGEFPPPPNPPLSLI